jgi:hypothetical protein
LEGVGVWWVGINDKMIINSCNFIKYICPNVLITREFLTSITDKCGVFYNYKSGDGYVRSLAQQEE